jgi:hypothetical protein
MPGREIENMSKPEPESTEKHDDPAQRAVLIISTAANSTEATVNTFEALSNYFPHCADEIRKTARIIGRTVPGEERGGRPEKSDAELVDRVVALGTARGGTADNLRWALRRIAREEATARRGTERANWRRLLPKVERALGKILAGN